MAMIPTVRPRVRVLAGSSKSSAFKLFHVPERKIARSRKLASSTNPETA
jgi:hypothetical protein